MRLSRKKFRRSELISQFGAVCASPSANAWGIESDRQVTADSALDLVQLFTAPRPEAY